MTSFLNARRSLLVAWITLSILWSVFPASAADTDQPTLADVLVQEEKGDTAVKDGDEPKAPAPARGPRDLLERDTPRSAVRGYIAAARAHEFDKAAEYLDLRNLPRGVDENRGAEYARQLKIVLDRKLWIDLERLSTDPKGHRDDRLPSYRDWVGTIDLDGEPVDILLQRVPVGGGDYVWKFSNATVVMVPALYATYGYGEIGEWLSGALPEIEFLGLYLWQ